MRSSETTAQDRLNQSVRNEALIELADQVLLHQEKSGQMPRRYLQPMFWLRTVLICAGSLSLGLLASTVTMLMIFVIVNMLLHI